MRNLKRALSLALSTVMLFGMMVVGTGASYKDVTSKHNQEAIDVMQAVGVMIGDDKGNFNPDQKVTRNEMAVIMANMLDLKIDDFNAASTKFTDVPAWAAKYVAACKADGIIAGYSDTKFGGSDTVTAAQAALMMLKALGYFQYQSDFGADWQLATVKQASKIDLFDGVDVSAGTALTRNEVAQLALNALEATMVETDGNGGTTIKGDGFEITTGSAKYTERTTTKYDYNKSGEKTLQLCENLYGKDLVKTSEGEDDFARPAVVWKYEKDTVGKYAEEPVLTYSKEVKIGDVKDDVDDADYGLADEVTIYSNGEEWATLKTADLKDTDKIGGKGVEVELFANDKDEIDTVVMVYTYAAKVVEVVEDDEDTKKTDERALKIVVYMQNDDATITLDKDFDGFDALYEEVEEDDIILVTPKGDDNDADEILTVAIPETVEGKVTARSGSSWVKVDGEKYEFAAMYSDAKFSVKDEGTFYLYNGYVLHYTEEEAAEDEYLYVVRSGEQAGKWDTTYYAEVVYTDGTSEVLDTDKKYEAGLYTYTFDKDDEVYELSTKGCTALGEVTITNGKTSVKTADGKVAVNSKTVFVNVELTDKGAFDDATVYTGYKKVSTMEATQAYAVIDGAAEYIFVVNGEVKSDSNDLIYVAGKSVSGLISDADLGNYYLYNAVVDGEVTEIMVAEKVGNELNGLYNKATVNDDDVYTKLEADKVEATTVKGDFKKAADEVITIAGEAYAYAEDVVVYVIDADGEIDEGSINRNYNDVEITFTVNDDDEVTALYIQK